MGEGRRSCASASFTCDSRLFWLHQMVCWMLNQLSHSILLKSFWRRQRKKNSHKMWEESHELVSGPQLLTTFADRWKLNRGWNNSGKSRQNQRNLRPTVLLQFVSYHRHNFGAFWFFFQFLCATNLSRQRHETSVNPPHAYGLTLTGGQPQFKKKKKTKTKLRFENIKTDHTFWFLQLVTQF